MGLAPEAAKQQGAAEFHQLPIQADRLLPLLPDDPPFIDLGKPIHRAHALEDIVANYADHPVVEDTIGGLFRYGYEQHHHVLFLNARDHVEAENQAYRRLPHDDTTITNYFKYLDRGLQTHVKLAGRKPRSRQNQAFIELTVAYQAIILSSQAMVPKYLDDHHLTGRKRVSVAEEDIMQDGYTGLVQGIQRYDHHSQRGLWDYAEDWIGQAIYSGFRLQRSNNPLSHEDELKWRRVRKAYIELMDEDPRSISYQKLAVNANVDLEEVINFIGLAGSTSTSLDAPLFPNMTSRITRRLIDTIPDEPFPPTPDSDVASDEHKIIEQLIAEAKLHPLAAAMVSLRYGVYIPELEGLTFNKTPTSYAEAFAATGSVVDSNNIDLAAATKLSRSSVDHYISVGMRALKAAAHSRRDPVLQTVDLATLYQAVRPKVNEQDDEAKEQIASEPTDAEIKPRPKIHPSVELDVTDIARLVDMSDHDVQMLILRLDDDGRFKDVNLPVTRKRPTGRFTRHYKGERLNIILSEIVARQKLKN